MVDKKQKSKKPNLTSMVNDEQKRRRKGGTKDKGDRR